MFDNNHLLLVLSLALWCVVHSGMISSRFIKIAKRRLHDRFRFYRLFYNVIAVITLVPIYVHQRSIESTPYFSWDGGWRILQFVLITLGIIFLLAGARHYDGLQFLGFRQLLSKNHAIGLSESGELHTSGILNITRHPWYVAAFFVLWARDINSVSLVINIVFSIYLFVGAVLEEQKLKAEFGRTYSDYQKRVSMFVPWKWLARQKSEK